MANQRPAEAWNLKTWSLTPHAFVIPVGLLSLIVGALVARNQLVLAIALIAIPLVVWLVVAYPGIVVGGLWLTALNGVPLLNLEGGGGQLRTTDISVIAIAMIAIAQWIVSPKIRRPLPSVIVMPCVFFGMWWLLTFARSLNAGIPGTDAFFFGRDFLSVVLIVPPAWFILQEPAAWRQCVIVILLGAGAYGLAYICGSLGLIDATSFTHPQQIHTIAGVQRLYTPMSDLIVMVAIFGAAILATTPRSHATPLIAVVTIITLLAFLLQLTRAAYLGMAVGLVIAVVITLVQGGQVRRMFLRRVSVFLMVSGIALFAVIDFGPGGGVTSVIDERISSGVSQVNEQSGTVGYRVKLYHEMLTVLGPDWPIGLGFLHPRDKYFPSLPSGSIRNSDVGLLNAVMTMGLTGLILLFGILFGFARYVAKTSDGRPTWLVVGMFSWLALLAATSLTLVTLFSPTGLISVGLTLVLCGVAIGPTPRLDQLHA